MSTREKTHGTFFKAYNMFFKIWLKYKKATSTKIKKKILLTLHFNFVSIVKY